MLPLLTTERLQLRFWQIEDLPNLVQMNQDEEVMKYFLSTMSNEDSIQFYNRIITHQKKHGFGLYVVEDKQTKSFLGYTGFMIAEFEADFTPCVEIGWRFNKLYWGNGYATEAAEACLHYGLSDLKFQEVHSFTSVHNNKSKAVMQRLGMQKIGEFNHPKIELSNKLSLHVHYLIQKT